MRDSIEDVRLKVISCTRCDLCKTRTNAVPGKGSVNAKVMFVGEAPGRTEDQRGEPFVGAAGKKLTLMLEKHGISRDSIYITNVVKCRPPNNRVPSDSERKACMEYLQSEIEIINPKIVCVLGNTASNSILGQSEITKNHGKSIEHDGRIYFLTFHPAATIYNQELWSVMESDIELLSRMLGIDNK
ncbi:uracil-DNA glycosylase [Candidatus Nitrosotenuis uzonensis]|uniref:Type-4 uracil-DNA glycosylase n=1 Tax=Candidatus Nitrosotenuis uzonensis TaxID=1407055 RepID=V6ATR0_9ARCH|nr:uracil-DNA glycosylase [Candidatus Nitrosotenuis uzonensis]CDI05823.1 Phage SPO1 DNA polymerase-related protein [Candidatus Nitrosotenuis uzonensis]